jgi:hypothetical protein
MYITKRRKEQDICVSRYTTHFSQILLHLIQQCKLYNLQLHHFMQNRKLYSIKFSHRCQKASRYNGFIFNYFIYIIHSLLYDWTTRDCGLLVDQIWTWVNDIIILKL